MADKFTFKQFQALYPDDAACLRAIMERRYGNAEACPKCGVVGTLTRIEKRRAFACKEGCHIYPCAGTVFEKSTTSLTLWFHAMYLMTATRNGVSAKELQRQLGVTYKCAWRIGHQLRELMSGTAGETPTPIEGHSEIDETYIGGKQRFPAGTKGRGTYLKNKTVVFGMLQREGDIRAVVVPNDKRATLLPIIRANIAKGATISSDNHGAYRTLKWHGYTHGAINHTINEWKRGIYCTNGIEGFWSHLKRGIKSTHVSVSRQWAQNYVSEFAFRYNQRDQPAQMFGALLGQITKAN